MRPTPILNQVKHSSVHDVPVPPEALFPLLCPVREFEWIPGWPCRVIYTASGIAEQGCVFVTDAPGEPTTTWLATSYDPAGGRVSYVRVTPERRVASLLLRVEAGAPGRSTLHVEFRASGLGPAGAEEHRLAMATGEPYATFAGNVARLTERFFVAGPVGTIPELRIHSDARERWSGAAAVAGDPDSIFPLLCPVREREWLPGWECELVHTTSGLVEPGCIWIRGAPGTPAGARTVCVATVHDPGARRLVFAAFTPDRSVEEVSLQVLPEGPGRSRLELQLSLTALDEQGRAQVRRVREDGGPYPGWLQDLARGLERFLAADRRPAALR